MKTMILAVATLFTAMTSSSLYAQDKLNPGDKLPTMSAAMHNATGKDITLKEAMGKNGLLIMFSCNTCPFVVRNQETTKKAIDYAKAHGVAMVIVNSNEAQRSSEDSYEAMKKYAKDQGYNVPYVTDEKSALADMFGASHTPEVFLFDKTNTLVYKGAMNDNPSNPTDAKKMYIEDAIDAVVAGKTPDPKVTKSIGCSIKRKA